MASFFQGLGQVIKGLGQIAWSLLETACAAVAFVVWGLFTLAKDGLNWAKKKFQQLGSKFKKQTTIDESISQKLKEFLDGQPINKIEEKLHLSSSVKDANTITLIAQDEKDTVHAFEFVETKGGSDIPGIVEQEID